MSKNKFYITTAIVYTNGSPHIGYAFELVLTDVLARWHRLQGDDTYFLTGTDEHGSSVAKAAVKAGTDPQAFVDRIAGEVQQLGKILNISNDGFVRTTDQVNHWPTAIKLWNILAEKGDIYKKKYEGLYCVGHEAFIKKSELVDGLCPLHQTAPEVVEEENWFFKITRYKDEIARLIENDDLKILPETCKKEILNLIRDSEDVSFSRPSSTLMWGIPVPNDPTQTMYVWVDALSNYISALGYASGGGGFKKYWPADVHLIGKDILRFHALIWPAILLSAGIELPKAIYVHGFINIDGQKMSKTIGNVIDPFTIVEKYGAEVVRYFLLREIPSGDDGDFSTRALEARYNGDLANGLGNLVQRVVTLIANNLDNELIYDAGKVADVPELAWVLDDVEFEKAMESFRLHDALAEIWKKIGVADAYATMHKPWALVKEDAAGFLKVMTALVGMVGHIAWLLQPFMPGTAEKVFAVFGLEGKRAVPDGAKLIVAKGEPLFPRLV